MHLLRRLGVGGIQELEGQPGDRPHLARLGDRIRRRQVGDRQTAPAIPDPRAEGDELPRLTVKQVAERVHRPARHRRAGDHILADRELVKGRRRARRDDWHLARGHIVGVNHAFHAAVVVDVRVRVDHRDDGLVGNMLTEQGHSLRRRFHPGRTVDDDQPAVALDDGQVARGRCCGPGTGDPRPCTGRPRG